MIPSSNESDRYATSALIIPVFTTRNKDLGWWSLGLCLVHSFVIHYIMSTLPPIPPDIAEMYVSLMSGTSFHVNFQPTGYPVQRVLCV